MTTITPEQINLRLKALSKEMQGFYFSTEVADRIRMLAKKNGVSEDKLDAIVNEVGFVTLGATPHEQLSEKLQEIGLSQEKAAAVAAEVERDILGNTNYKQDTKLRTEERKPEQKPPIPPTPFPKGRGNNLPLGEVGGVASTPPRVVPIRKPPPPSAPSPLGRAGGGVVPTLQTLLADIRRGTAFDENRIADSYRKTPIEVRQALESVGFLSRLQEIARKFGLNVEETGEFVSESGLVMIGLTKPHEFVDHLSRRLRLPKDRALALGQAANMEIFRPVREILRKMNQPTTTPPPPSAGASLLNQGGDSKENLRFAPSHQESPPQLRRSTPSPASPAGGEARGEVVVSPPTKYTQDPYREPFE